MTMGQVLVLLAIVLQSVGEVLYGTFLGSVSTPMFVSLSVGLTAITFLAISRFHLPREGRAMLAMLNIWTAVCFISVFYALKYLPPAICSSIEIGMSLLVAIGLTAVQKQTWPRSLRALACLGILAGCAVLSWAEIRAVMPEADAMLTWSAILASIATGTSAAMIVAASKQLSTMGWTASTVLAHRFYLTIGVTLAWVMLEPGADLLPGAGTLALVGAIGAVAILIPLLLFQVALRRTDELTVLICSSAQPLLSFLIALPSPAYDWSMLTLFGVLIVTLFVGLDVAAYRRPAPWPGKAAAGTS
jgi:drug/metabolite transporter (DMT)-like permease